MPDLRSPLILLALPMGCAAGASAWLASGANASLANQLSAFEKSLPPPQVQSGSPPAGGSAAAALASPLFVLTTGPNAVADVTVTLVGIAKTGRRSAALLSLNGEKAAWMEVGETRDGVTLQDVGAAKVTLDTPTGFRDVVLGEGTPPTGQTPSASPAPLTPAPSSRAVGGSEIARSGLTPPASAPQTPPPFRAPHP